MAGAGYKDFTAGDVLTAAQVDTYLMEQSTMVFASASARDTALSAAKSEGMMAYLSDAPNRVTYYDGSAWNTLWSEWTSFTPSWQNVTTTDATITGTYKYGPDGIRVAVSITFGASTAFTGDVSFTIPNSETARSVAGHKSLGVINCREGSGDETGHCMAANGSTTIVLFSAGDNVTATVPHTWGSGDDLYIDITVAL